MARLPVVGGRGGVYEERSFRPGQGPALSLFAINVDAYAGSDDQKWATAVARAVAKTSATTLGVLIAPAGRNFVLTGTVDIPARVGMWMPGVRVTVPGGFDALVIGPTDATNAAQGSGERPTVILPPEIVSTSGTPFAGTARGLTLRSMPLTTVIAARAFGVPVGFDMLGNCFGSTWNGPRARGCRIAMRLRGVNISATDAGAGNDITLVNPWLSGRDAGLWIDPRGGAFHVFGGQINAGEGLVAADDTLGAVAWGRNLDNLADVAGVGGIDLNGTSFEGTQYAWNLRGFSSMVLRVRGCTIRSNIAGKPQIGVIKTTNSPYAAFDDLEVYGPFTSATLAAIAFGGGVGDQCSERGSLIAATVGTAADGTGGSAWPIGMSMMSQMAFPQGVAFDRPFISAIGNSLSRGMIDGAPIQTQGLVAALPAASAAYRGKQMIVQGNGSTTADILYACLLSAAGAYSWKQIVSG